MCAISYITGVTADANLKLMLLNGELNGKVHFASERLQRANDVISARAEATIASCVQVDCCWIAIEEVNVEMQRVLVAFGDVVKKTFGRDRFHTNVIRNVVLAVL